jgi:O-antigen ligase
MMKAWAADLTAVLDPRLTNWLLGAGIVAGAVVIGAGAGAVPFLTMGVVVGALLAVFALTKPLALVTLMLVIGPVDLSFLTGGFKSMFGQLGGLDMNGIRLIGLTAALGLVTIADPRVGRLVFRPTAIFYAALLAYGAFTLTFSPVPLHGLRLLLKLGYPFLVFIVIAGLSPTRHQLDRLMDAVLIGAAVLCMIVNPLYVIYGDFERVIGGWVRLQGLGVHQNPFAFYLTIPLLIGIVRFTTRRQVRYLLLAALCSAWMVLTITRIAFLGVVVALLATGVLSAVAARHTRFLLAAVAVGVLLAVPYAPPVLERTLGFVPSPGELVTLLRNPQALVQVMNWEGRQAVWAVVFQAFQTSPVGGLGLGASSFVLTVNFPWFALGPPHNDYLRLLTDTGVVGAALFSLAMLAWTAVATGAARLADRTTREYALSAVGSIAAFATVGLTDNPFDYYGQITQYVGFLCGGAVAAAACYRRAAGEAVTSAPLEAAPIARQVSARDRR